MLSKNPLDYPAGCVQVHFISGENAILLLFVFAPTLGATVFNTDFIKSHIWIEFGCIEAICLPELLQLAATGMFPCRPASMYALMRMRTVG